MFDKQRNLQLHRMRLVHQTTELVAAAFPAAVVALGALRLQAYLLKRYAEPDIADRYLEPLLSGELYGSFGVTEPCWLHSVRSTTAGGPATSAPMAARLLTGLADSRWSEL
jgi:alkylation response protein AidB-like acyl-CoA dehydrogenase